jgi:hypothetical protein
MVAERGPCLVCDRPYPGDGFWRKRTHPAALQTRPLSCASSGASIQLSPLRDARSPSTPSLCVGAILRPRAPGRQRAWRATTTQWFPAPLERRARRVSQQQASVSAGMEETPAADDRRKPEMPSCGRLLPPGESGRPHVRSRVVARIVAGESVERLATRSLSRRSSSRGAWQSALLRRRSATGRSRPRRPRTPLPAGRRSRRRGRCGARWPARSCARPGAPQGARRRRRSRP